MSILAAAAAGIILGLRYKAPALIAMSALLALVILAWNGAGGSPSVTFPNIVFLVLALQAGYVLGLWLAIAWRRYAENGR
jgi:hypothetical protein